MSRLKTIIVTTNMRLAELLLLRQPLQSVFRKNGGEKRTKKMSSVSSYFNRLSAETLPARPVQLAWAHLAIRLAFGRRRVFPIAKKAVLRRRGECISA